MNISRYGRISGLVLPRKTFKKYLYSIQRSTCPRRSRALCGESDTKRNVESRKSIQQQRQCHCSRPLISPLFPVHRSLQYRCWLVAVYLPISRCGVSIPFETPYTIASATTAVSAKFDGHANSSLIQRRFVSRHTLPRTFEGR